MVGTPVTTVTRCSSIGLGAALDLEAAVEHERGGGAEAGVHEDVLGRHVEERQRDQQAVLRPHAHVAMDRARRSTRCSRGSASRPSGGPSSRTCRGSRPAPTASMSRAGSALGPPAPNASSVGSPSTSPSQITTRSRRSPSPTSGASRGQSASTVNTTPAPESSRRTASSSVVSITFDGHRDGAELLDGHVGDRERGNVGQEEGHAVAGPDARRRQPERRPAGRPVELAVGQAAVLEQDGRLSGKWRAARSTARAMFTTASARGSPSRA